MAEKKKAEPTGLGQIGKPIPKKFDKQFKLKDSDIVIMVPSTKGSMKAPSMRVEKRSGGKVCKLATKGKGKAYGKNS